MFKTIKNAIVELAKQAVSLAEETLTGSEGEAKKEMAIAYVISNIPVISPFKTIVAKILSSFIDDAIELAVEYMASFSTETTKEI
ncbi:MAG: hypothetical protein R3Y28_07805 [Candidatus Gastranaerophilales bacterium]